MDSESTKKEKNYAVFVVRKGWYPRYSFNLESGDDCLKLKIKVRGFDYCLNEISNRYI